MMMKQQSMEAMFNAESGGGSSFERNRARFKKLRDMEYEEIVSELKELEQEQKSGGTLDAGKTDRQADLLGRYKEMEKCMAEIDKDPSSFEAILTYGNAPLKELENVTRGMMSIQGKFADQVNVMAGVLDGVDGRMHDLKKFGGDVKDGLGRLAKAGGKGLKGILRGLSALTKTGKSRSEDEKFVDEMQQKLPEKVKEMQKLNIDMQKTEVGLQQVMNEAEKLGITRAETTEKLTIYVNCAKEVLRRYDEEYIKEAREDFDASGNDDDKARLELLMERREDFIGRMLTLKGSQVTGQVAAEQLRRIIGTLKDQRKKIEDIRVNGIPEWMALIAEAGIAGSQLKISQKIAKSDKAADELFDLITGMIEKSDEMTRKAKARGTIDPDKLIEAANKMKNLLDKDVEDRKARLEAVQETYNKLDQAHKNLLEASDSNRQKALLGSEEDGEAKPKKKATNDNQQSPTQKRRDSGFSQE